MKITDKAFAYFIRKSERVRIVNEILKLYAPDTEDIIRVIVGEDKPAAVWNEPVEESKPEEKAEQGTLVKEEKSFRITDSEKDEICRMKEKGISVKDIMAQTGRSQVSVKKILNARGIK